jgi:hypothetical protein
MFQGFIIGYGLMYTMDQLVVTFPESVPINNNNILNKRPTIINGTIKNNIKPPKR